MKFFRKPSSGNDWLNKETCEHDYKPLHDCKPLCDHKPLHQPHKAVCKIKIDNSYATIEDYVKNRIAETKLCGCVECSFERKILRDIQKIMREWRRHNQNNINNNPPNM